MKIAKRQLRRIIREAINEAEFYDETPEGQLRGTEAEDARFTQDLKAEKIMEQAGLTKEEISWMTTAIKNDESENADAFYSPIRGTGKKIFEKLYDFLGWGDNAVMPYTAVKGVHADPSEWILEYLAGNVEKHEDIVPVPSRPWAAK